MKKLGMVLLAGALMSMYSCKKEEQVKPVVDQSVTLADQHPPVLMDGDDSGEDGHPIKPPQ